MPRLTGMKLNKFYPSSEVKLESNDLRRFHQVPVPTETVTRTHVLPPHFIDMARVYSTDVYMVVMPGNHKKGYTPERWSHYHAVCMARIKASLRARWEEAEDDRKLLEELGGKPEPVDPEAMPVRIYSEEPPCCSQYDHCVLVEVWSDQGDDGHTCFEFFGYRLMTEKNYRRSCRYQKEEPWYQEERDMPRPHRRLNEDREEEELFRRYEKEDE
jgi:hypothetical protein